MRKKEYLSYYKVIFPSGGSAIFYPNGNFSCNDSLRREMESLGDSQVLGILSYNRKGTIINRRVMSLRKFGRELERGLAQKTKPKDITLKINTD